MLRTIVTVSLLALLCAPVVQAEDDAIAQLRARIAEVEPDFEPDEIRRTPVEGLFEVVSGANVFYMTGDGEYLLRGELVDLADNRNLTAQRRTELIHRRVESVGEDSMLVYQPKKGPAEHSITVFTDTSCPYCQRLHRGLMQMIEQYPVKVRYLMFPRAGLQARAADTLRNVWCAADPQQAMTAAKAGQRVQQRDASCETPIREHYQLAQEIGVRGTPYLLVDDGPIVPGYRENAILLHMMGLKEEAGG